jgi:hypothetical protein
MKLRNVLPIIIGIACIYSTHADTLFVHAGFGATVYLPDNWVLEQKSDSQIILYDQSWTFGSHLSVMRHNRISAYFPTPEEWTRAHFVAYKMVCENTLTPWGAVLYYDSSITSRQGNLWAPELYCTYFSLDTTVGAWSEYIRFAASGDYGYELYAMGDTTDMLNNVPTYAAILQGIEIPGYSADRVYYSAYPDNFRAALKKPSPQYMHDMLGRSMKRIMPAQAKPRAMGFYVAPHYKVVEQLR